MNEMEEILISKGIKSLEIIQELGHEAVLYLSMLDGTHKKADCLPGRNNINEFLKKEGIIKEDLIFKKY